MHHTSVTSSNIKSVGYDETSRDMEIHFANGTKYRYHNVEPRTHQQLLAAKSVGKFFHERIRSNHKGSPV